VDFTLFLRKWQALEEERFVNINKFMQFAGFDGDSKGNDSELTKSLNLS
jgi:hypothetical protein